MTPQEEEAIRFTQLKGGDGAKSPFMSIGSLLDGSHDEGDSLSHSINHETEESEEADRDFQHERRDV